MTRVYNPCLLFTAYIKTEKKLYIFKTATGIVSQIIDVRKIA